MNKLLALVVCAGACAISAIAEDTTPVCLKGRVKDNGNLLILGSDNVEREAVLLTPAEYASLTNAMTYLSGIKEYREKIHGKIAKRIVDAETKTVVYHYADGFSWSEPMKLFPGRPSRPTERVRAATTSDDRPRAMSDAQWQALKAKRDAKKPRTVNVTYGPGGTVKEVK